MILRGLAQRYKWRLPGGLEPGVRMCPKTGLARNQARVTWRTKRCDEGAYARAQAGVHMKAFLYHEYGSPDVLHCEEIPKPVPADRQVLIRVRAAAVNPLDVHLMKGEPYFARFFFGFPKPHTRLPGRDVAGVVETIGERVATLKPGDAVFGVCTGGKWTDRVDGAFAEFACTLESAVARKPANITFEEAASVPIAALTALQALRDHGGLKPRMQVLIHGAGGGVGSYAVQLAKILGGKVTAVTAAENFDRLGKLGADRLIDYTKSDYTQSGDRYDLILDCYASHSLLACRRALSVRGVYVVVGGPTGHALREFAGTLAAAFVAMVCSRFANRKLKMFIAKVNANDLNLLREMLADGRLIPVVDRCFPFEEAAEALRYQIAGHPNGKVVVSLG